MAQQAQPITREAGVRKLGAPHVVGNAGCAESRREQDRFSLRIRLGAATSAYGIEANDWVAWERNPEGVCAEPAGTACDHYNRFAADAALMTQPGLKS